MPEVRSNVSLMSKVRKSSPFLLLIAIGLVMLLRLRAHASGASLSEVEITTASPTAQRCTALELTHFYDKDSSFDAPGCWEAVPRGLQTLANIRFRIAGLIE